MTRFLENYQKTSGNILFFLYSYIYFVLPQLHHLFITDGYARAVFHLRPLSLLSQLARRRRRNWLLACHRRRIFIFLWFSPKKSPETSKLWRNKRVKKKTSNEIEWEFIWLARCVIQEKSGKNAVSYVFLPAYVILRKSRRRRLGGVCVSFS